MGLIVARACLPHFLGVVGLDVSTSTHVSVTVMASRWGAGTRLREQGWGLQKASSSAQEWTACLLQLQPSTVLVRPRVDPEGEMSAPVTQTNGRVVTYSRGFAVKVACRPYGNRYTLLV